MRERVEYHVLKDGRDESPASRYVRVAAGLPSDSLDFTPLVIRLAYRVRALDLPGPRRIHAEPTPRFGGIALYGAGLVVALAGGALAEAGGMWVIGGWRGRSPASRSARRS